MLSCPRIGTTVQIWYAARWRATMPLHGRMGVVRVASHGRPRNHGVEIDGVVWIVPAGNLRIPPETLTRTAESGMMTGATETK